MNKQRRNKLGNAFDLIEQVKNILEEVKNEEQEAHDNLPESFRYGDKGQEMEGYIEMIEEAYNYLDDAASVIEQV